MSATANPAGDGYARVASLRDFAGNALLGVTLPGGERVCLIRDAHAVRAVGDECPHQGFAISSGELIGDGTIECVWHGARFDCRSGAVVRGPAEEGLTIFETRVVGEDVFVGRRVT